MLFSRWAGLLSPNIKLIVSELLCVGVIARGLLSSLSKNKHGFSSPICHSVSPSNPSLLSLSLLKPFSPSRSFVSSLNSLIRLNFLLHPSHDLDYIVLRGCVCSCLCVWRVVKPGPHIPLWPGCTKEMPHRPQDVLFTVKCSYNSNALRFRKGTVHQRAVQQFKFIF